MGKNNALVAAGVIFLLVAVMHLVRVVMKLQVVVGGKEIPLAASTAGVIAAGLLCIWMFAAAKQK